MPESLRRWFASLSCRRTWRTSHALDSRSFNAAACSAHAFICAVNASLPMSERAASTSMSEREVPHLAPMPLVLLTELCLQAGDLPAVLEQKIRLVALRLLQQLGHALGIGGRDFGGCVLVRQR